MKRFLILSILLHGAVVSFLFSGEFPRAEKLFAWSKIEVVLVQETEERKATPPKNLNKDLNKAKARLPVKKEVPRIAPKPEEKPKIEEKKTEIKKEAQPPEMKARAEQTGAASPAAEPQASGRVRENAEHGTAEPEPKKSVGGGSSVVSFQVPKGSATPEAKEPSVPVSGSGEPSETAHLLAPPSKGGDSILQQIIRRIEAAKRYPRAARKMGLEGIARVRFKIKPGGEVETAEIEESSGSDILDKASLETVRAAAPLPYKEGWLKVGIVFKIL